MPDETTPSTPMARFADALLAGDLPGLADDRRRQAVEFVLRRAAVLPSVARFGVELIGRVVGLVSSLAGTDRAIRLVTTLPIPLLAEYPRLIRSLAYAFVWETWPDTQADGSTR